MYLKLHRSFIIPFGWCILITFLIVFVLINYYHNVFCYNNEFENRHRHDGLSDQFTWRLQSVSW